MSRLCQLLRLLHCRPARCCRCHVLPGCHVPGLLPMSTDCEFDTQTSLCASSRGLGRMLYVYAAGHRLSARTAALRGQVASPAHAAEACSIRHQCQAPVPCQLNRHPLRLGGRHIDPQTSANAVFWSQSTPDAVKLLLRYTYVLLTKQLQRSCDSFWCQQHIHSRHSKRQQRQRLSRYGPL